MEEHAETHTLVVGASDHRRECAVRAPADAVVAWGDSVAGGMVAVARNGKECTRRALVATGFAWRPLPHAFNLTRFRIQPTKNKHTDHVFLSSACEPLDPACESLNQACRCRLASTNQEEA